MSEDASSVRIKTEIRPWFRNLFIQAITEGDVEKVSEHLQHPDCDIKERGDNDFGKTTLMYAAESDSPKIVNLLLHHDPSASSVRDEFGTTVLMYAVQSDSPHAPEIVSLLLHHDPSAASVNTEVGGQTVLMYAAKSHFPHSPEIVRLLLQHDSVDKSAVDNRGFTGFIYAVVTANFAIPVFYHIISTIIKLFSEKCDYTKMLCSAGYSGLDHMIISSELHKQHFKTCSRGIELFHILSQCYTPNTLPLAFTYCSLEICEKLLYMYKQFSNSSLPDGETVLHSAIGTNSIPKCRLVMTFGPETKSLWKGLSPLEMAILNKCKRPIIELVSEKSTMVEIEVSIKRCLCKGETMLELAHRLGMKRWINHFESSNYSSDAGKQAMVNAPSKPFTVTHIASWLDVNQYCSFKVRISNQKQHKSSSQKAKEVTVVKYCRDMIDLINVEVERIQHCVTKLISNVADVLTRNKSFMAFKCMLSGSMKENTKCFKPDELDFMCVFMNTFGLLFRSNNIQCNESCPWWELSSKEGLLDMRLVAQAFYDLVMKTIVSTFDALTAELGQLSLTKYPLQRMNKISQLKLVWNGDAFPGLVINVDLVPSFEHPSYSPMELPLVGRFEDFYLLAKASRHNYTHQLTFHLSYCRAEHAIMAGLPDYIRDGYIVAKAIRIADIAGEGINLVQLDVEEDIRTDDFLTSYILKNALFNILTKHGIKHVQECRYAWAETIYTELEQNLKNRTIGVWYNVYSSLLNCIKCKDARACCQRRAIMLAFTQQIRRWLQENMDELRKN